MEPSDPDEERIADDEPDHEEPDDSDLDPEPEPRAFPNPYITAAGVIAAIIVIFALSSVTFVVRLVIAFAIVTAAAYLSVTLARRH